MEIKNGCYTWGPWELDGNHLSLANGQYDVDLRELTTNARVLDMIMQLTSKRWPNAAEIVTNFLYAIEACLEPQVRLCSLGQESGPCEFDKAAMLLRLRERLQWQQAANLTGAGGLIFMTAAEIAG